MKSSRGANRATVCVATALWATVMVFVACRGKSPTSPSEPPLPTPTFVVSGTVRDAGNFNFLAGAVVRLTDGTASSQMETGFEGVFSFAGVRGNVTLTVTATGYETASTTTNVMAATSLDFSLRRVVGRAVSCGDAPDTGNRVLPLFSRPFAGVFPLSNYFDHDLPLGTYAGNGYQLTYCDERVTGRIDAHQGYDWLLPSGTPVLAVADGEVAGAGSDPPFFCVPLGRTVSDQRFVEIRHPALNGERFSSVFVHLSRIDVNVGQVVTRGQTIGLSGNTGCSTEPHLHLQVWRLTHTNDGRPTLVDPYGWEGLGQDPWSQHPSGSGSIWLWRRGESPVLRPR